jgi:predicted permease
MVWEAFAFAIVGLGVAFAAVRTLPDRFPTVRLVLATGPAAALLGGFVTRAILGAGEVMLALLAGVVMAAAMLSLLVRPSGGRQDNHGGPMSITGRA